MRYIPLEAGGNPADDRALTTSIEAGMVRRPSGSAARPAITPYLNLIGAPGDRALPIPLFGFLSSLLYLVSGSSVISV